MRSDQVFELLVKIENSIDVNELKWNSFVLWPLLRQALYVELLNSNEINNSTDTRGGESSSNGVTSWMRDYGGKILNHNFGGGRCRPAKKSSEERAFLSRKVYLQKLPSGEYFDRIIDPLIFISKNQVVAKKYYVGSVKNMRRLSFAGSSLMTPPSIRKQHIPKNHIAIIQHFAEAYDINGNKIIDRYSSNFDGFVRWYDTAVKFIKARTKLKEIYLTSWYFPDMMGVCAAASTQGIKVIDVQHGKQGRYQAMYSGWTKIPVQGYDLMPDGFWCWGQPSCDHILASSPDRKVHRPFVGGFPWLDYYKSYLSQFSVSDAPGLSSGGALRVLVTTQSRQSANIEPIPEFLIQFMNSIKSGATRFTFRCHPNDHAGVSYCMKRLAMVPEAHYSIDDGKDNLYDKLLSSTHHITAYSSCCYEAEALGVPTLLFGEDAKRIYAEEINAGMFDWTSGSLTEIENWMELAKSKKSRDNHNVAPYIVSSLEHSFRALESNGN